MQKLKIAAAIISFMLARFWLANLLLGKNKPTIWCMYIYTYMLSCGWITNIWRATFLCSLACVIFILHFNWSKIVPWHVHIIRDNFTNQRLGVTFYFVYKRWLAQDQNAVITIGNQLVMKWEGWLSCSTCISNVMGKTLGRSWT